MRSEFYEKMTQSSAVRKIASLDLEVDPALPETNRELQSLFKQPNQDLGDFLNRDLSHWDL
jgi:hypothetical protein